MVAPSTFLFVAWDSGGSVPFNLTLVSALLDRGHRVHVLSEPSVEARARAAGASFSPFNRAPVFELGRGEATGLDDHPGEPAFERFRDRLTCGPALEYALDTIDAVDEVDADVVVADYLLLGAFIGAAARRRPWVVLRPILTERGGNPPERWAPGIVQLNRAREQLALPPIVSHHELYDGAARFLVQTTEAFNPPLHDVPPNVVFVGPPLRPPLPARHVRHGQPAHAVISLGTTQQGQATIVDRVVEGVLRAVPTALVLAGGTFDPTERRWSRDVEIKRWMPHLEAFADTDVVVCHGGPGTVLTALAMGVPVVSMALGRDQFTVSERVAATGVGVSLPVDATEAAIADAIFDVLAAPPPGLLEMQRAIEADVRAARAVVELEQAADGRDPRPTYVGRLDAREWVGRRVSVVVDRPLGSLHPTTGTRYELNYGFVPDTMAPDGAPLDAYLLGPTGPVATSGGVVVAVVRRFDDVEDKLVVSDAGGDWALDEVARAVHFQERYFAHEVVMGDPR